MNKPNKVECKWCDEIIDSSFPRGLCNICFKEYFETDMEIATKGER